MFTKTTLNLGLTGLLTLGLAACSGKSDNNPQPASVLPTETATAVTAGYTPGTAASTADVSMFTATPAAGTDLAAYPELSSDVALLSTVNHVVTTTAGNVELYNGNNVLQMALSKDASGNWTVVQSASAFSVSKSDIDRVCKYILNQREHHRKISFSEEYEEFIKFYQKTLQPSKKYQSK